MLIEQLVGFARVFARGRIQRIAVAVGRAPGPCPTRPSLVPEVAVVESALDVTLTLDLPGATADDVTVYWDEAVHRFCAYVDRSRSDASHDFYVEVPLPHDVDGTRWVCTFTGSTLWARAPLTDTPAMTGLALSHALQWAPALTRTTGELSSV
jgi:HSP20 family molecular chaperone IbpA